MAIRGRDSVILVFDTISAMLHTENDIRDFLAANIDCIESGLVFLAKELYIPNNLGTRSFIDLVAADPRGHIVLDRVKAHRRTFA